MKFFPVVGLAVDLPPCQLHLTGLLEVLTLLHVTILYGDFTKEKVAQHCNTNTNELTQAVTDAFNEVTHQMFERISHRTWRRINICYDNDGAQTD